MGRRMSKEGIATLQHASMGLLCDPRKQEEILNDLWVVWVKLALELELENIVRRRFPGHSKGAYGRSERWIDELGFMGSDVRFLIQRQWSVIVSWFAAGAFTNWWKLPRKSRSRRAADGGKAVNFRFPVGFDLASRFSRAARSRSVFFRFVVCHKTGFLICNWTSKIFQNARG